MKEGKNMTTDLTGLIPHGWAGGEAVTKWWRGKHLHLYRLRKNCAQCGTEMILDVTKAAIVGTAKNAGLHLTRCPQCRAASKEGGATSRPLTQVAQPTSVPNTDMTEMETLRTANVTMKEELDGLYTLNKELREKLARYETNAAPRPAENPFKKPAMPLGPVMHAPGGFKAPEPIAKSSVDAELLQKWLEKKNAKMPWE
jgi:hypothetical protein